MGRYTALGRASKEYVKIEDALDKSIFKQEMEAIFNLSPNEIDDIMAKSLKEQKKKDEEENYNNSLAEAQKLISLGEIKKAEQILSQVKKEHKKDDFLLKPYTVENLKQDLSTIQEGLKTGYKSLDATIQIPQEAITIIAGRPSHGKTTALLNFFVNMVKLYPDREFYFFSYEEPKNQILLKVLNILTGEFINEANNLLLTPPEWLGQELRLVQANREIPALEKKEDKILGIEEFKEIYKKSKLNVRQFGNHLGITGQMVSFLLNEKRHITKEVSDKVRAFADKFS